MIGDAFTQQFITGLFLILIYQGSQFAELGSENSPHISGLRATDYVPSGTFYSALLIYLAVSAVAYWLACQISPSVINGAVGLFQGTPDPNVPIELYIAAIYMGLSHRNVPFLSGLGRFQKDVFHHFIGIPRKVDEMSEKISNAYIASISNPEDISKKLHYLASDKWKFITQDYADAPFIAENLKKYGLDDESEIDQISIGSSREKKSALRRMIAIYTFATAKQSGGSSLTRLAQDLGVQIGNPGRSAVAALLSFFLIGLLIIMIIVVLAPSAPRYLGVDLGSPWPSTLSYSLITVLSHVGPVLVAVGIAIYLRPRKLIVSEVQRSSPSNGAERNGKLYFGIFISAFLTEALFILYSFGASFSGIYNGLKHASLAPIVFAIFLALIALIVAHYFLVIGKSAVQNKDLTLVYAKGFVVVAVISCIYIFSYVEQVFVSGGVEVSAKGANALMILVVALHSIFALLSFRTAVKYYGHVEIVE